jgi:hypothetical protein
LTLAAALWFAQAPPESSHADVIAEPPGTTPSAPLHEPMHHEAAAAAAAHQESGPAAAPVVIDHDPGDDPNAQYAFIEEEGRLRRVRVGLGKSAAINPFGK